MISLFDDNKFHCLIAGGRDFNHWQKYNRYLRKIDNFLKNYNDIEMITGCAKGADQIPYFYKVWYGYNVKEFPANWDKFGKKAGYLRNLEMANYLLTFDKKGAIIFWNGKSRGSKNMIEVCKEKEIPLRVIYY